MPNVTSGTITATTTGIQVARDVLWPDQGSTVGVLGTVVELFAAGHIPGLL